MKKLLVALALLFAPALASAQSYAQSAQGLVVKLASANMNVTTDQAINIPLPKYAVNKIVVTNCSASMTLAAGGFYSASAKGGTAIVAAAQVYSALTTATGALNATISAAGSGNSFAVQQIFFSLTTAQGAASTCDIYVFVDALY